MGFFYGRGEPFSRIGEEETKVERKLSDIVLLKRLLMCIAPYKRRIAGLAAIMVSTTIVGLIIPIMGKILLDDMILPGMITGDMSPLNLWLGANLILQTFEFAIHYGRAYLTAWIGNTIVYQLKEDMVAQLQVMSIRYLSEGETGRIMSRISNDVGMISQFMGSGLLTVVIDLISIFGTFFLMFSLNVELTLISLVVVPVMFFIPYFSKNYMKKAARKTMVKVSGMTSKVQESVSGMRVVQSLTQESRDKKIFDIANLAEVKARLWAAIIHGLFGLGIRFGFQLGRILLLWYGVTQIVNGNVTIGTFSAFNLLVYNFFGPIMTITNFYGSFQNTMVATERVFELMDTEKEVEIAPKSERVDLDKVQGEIVYDHVSFAYDQENFILKDINLTIRQNEKVALVGPTGAGKTTMINLLVRFYDPQKGTITLDGHDLKKISPESLRNSMGIVPQDTFLFQGTVKKNISYGKPDATDDEVIEAAKTVNAHEFIISLPKGYQTLIREGATNISVGQRQLITFARALLVDPKILILDEATSSVDPYTELIIQKGLEELMKNRTTIIIAHRLSTVRNSDKIVVIDKGEIIEMGRHEELLEGDGLYRRLYMRQFRDLEEEMVKKEKV